MSQETPKNPPTPESWSEKSKHSRWQARHIGSSDQDFLWEMLYIALWDAPDEPRRPRSVLEDPRIKRLVENWGRPDDLGLLALDPVSGERIGAVWTRLDGYDQIDGFGCAYPVIGIAVEQAFQKRGVGTFLLSCFIDKARASVPGIRLGVNPRNESAIRLYERFGFVEYAIGNGGYPQMELAFSA